MISVIAVVLVLGGLIFFHELGHFVMARAFGMGVHSFSLGFGPRIFGWTRGQTEYRLSAIPLGGYVKLAGEQPDETPDESFTERQLFSSRPAWQRFLVVAAGPLFNFLLGWLIYWALFLAAGHVTLFDFRVQQVMPDSPAMTAGIVPGDLVTRIDDKPIYFRESLMLATLFSKQEPLELTLRAEDGSQRTVSVTPAFLTEKDRESDMPWPKIGIVHTEETRNLPLGLDLGFLDAGDKALAMIGKTLRSVWLLVDGTIPLKGVGGPILIAQAVGQEARSGLVDVLLMAAFISINLGILNLLPIPVLDGGHLLFFGFEALTGRKVNEGLRRIATYAGVAFLVALMALAFYNDLHRLLG